jgi:hypothetical protein
MLLIDFNMLELDVAYPIKVTLQQNLVIHSPNYNCDIASHDIITKKLSAQDITSSRHPDGYYAVSVRIPSSQKGVESVASCTMKHFSVNHVIIVTVYNQLLSSTEVKIPVLLWPKKIN